MGVAALKPEDRARQNIDRLLGEAGWFIQDQNDLNLGAGLGVVVRNFALQSGFADYMLFVSRKAVGVVEAKPEGTTLSGVADQSDKYLGALAVNIPHWADPLPFAYESTGVETFFRSLRDPEPRSRRVFAFHKPETLLEWVSEQNSLRRRLQNLPLLMTEGLRNCQVEAITNLERSFAEDRPRALIQMASGSGKTFAAVTFVYRLIKFAGARRILFLVDRNTLGRQAKQEFQQYRTPDDGRIFTELYNLQHLASNKIDPVSRVCITTIQRLYSMLKGEAEFNPELEEESVFQLAPSEEKPLEVTYNSNIPIDMFDFIITDECHRSIYHLWRQVLEYFDAYIIGLTATPSKQTLGFFNQNLVSEYGHERAIADDVNVGYEVYRIATKITQRGSEVKAGFFVDKRDKLSRRVRWEQLDADLAYEARQLDRDVVAPDQIRTVIRTFRDRLFTEIFPGRTVVPKTLIFAKDDSHAEDIVQIAREEFGKGNEFCKKITYKTTGDTIEALIQSFRISYNPRIAVTVDMISTGTDVKPLECLLFMRDVHSNVYFEQMKGRGMRTITPTDLTAVTPDAVHKSGFVIVDAVGVCESDKTDSRPLERKRSVPFDKLINSVALGMRDEDTLTSLAGRLARLDKEIEDEDRKEVEAAAGGKSLSSIVNGLLDAVDPDVQFEKAKQLFNTENPSAEQLKRASEELVKIACGLFDDPKFRNKVIDVKRQSEQIIDVVSKDKIEFAGFDKQSATKARLMVDSFKKFIDQNKDELTALQIIYSKPYGQRHLTYDAIKQLADAIRKPPYNLTPELLWLAYEQLEKSKVKGAGPQKLLTNIVSLVRFSIGAVDVLEPFSETVNHRFEEWLSQQERSGKRFSQEQKDWLKMIKDHIATSLSVGIEDFENVPFNQKGGAVKANKLFGQDLSKILEELNTVLVK
jgi:type I restriction enzyme R subunit